MLSKAIRDKYTAIIGLEVHAQLATQTKMFCADLNKYGEAANTHISPISLGHPGVLPKVNKKAIDYAIMMGLACESSITRENIFDRKNYFYPDLPKGYQVTQDKAPICVGGQVWVKLEEAYEESPVVLNRIHMEEDAGKSMHISGKPQTFVDYNRAGVPLIEMVTEPVIKSSAEAAAFLNEVRKLVRYLEICDGNMEQGSLRCDANISVMLNDATALGAKVEVKNMNSIRNVRRAIDHEIERQIGLIEQGSEIISETRDFDDASGKTAGMRTKEALNDYRYFPEPDLCPIIVDRDWIDSVKKKMPALPRALKQKFVEIYGLPVYDAQVLTDDKHMAIYFDDLCNEVQNYKMASNWLMGTVKSWLKENRKTINDFSVAPKRLADLLNLVDQGMVSNSAASQSIFPELMVQTDKSALEIAQSKNLIQDSSSDSIQPIVDEVLREMADKVAAYKAGRKGLLGLFMGEVMKRSKGKADPKKATELIKEMID